MLELFYPHLQSSNVFSHELRPCLSLAIIVLATIGLLRANTLLTSRLYTIASLQGYLLAVNEGKVMPRFTILRFLHLRHAFPEYGKLRPQGDQNPKIIRQSIDLPLCKVLGADEEEFIARDSAIIKIVVV